ncbi:MAG TPA: PAS domain-containing protein [Terriglobia bacterium]|nr:PAS domain-containing protein [Terriglobia bacterium]
MVSGPVAALPNLRDERLLRLYGYWRDKAAGRRMPSYRDIDALDMKAWLGNLVLVEFTDSLFNYRVRLEGTHIEDYYGDRRTGHGVELVTSAQERELLVRQYRPVYEDGRPAYYEAAFENSYGIFSHQAKLLLPLSPDGQRVNMILAGIYFL